MERLCVRIDAIPREHQRYATEGDWLVHGDSIDIYVSGDSEDQQFLYAVHELIEAYLCKKRGITTEQVDAFDMAFKGEGEPGDSPAAPYRNEHRFAMLIEHLVARELGLAGYGRVE